MFKRKVYIDNSSVEGLGLFAGEDIKKGEIVYVHSPALQLTLSAVEFEKLDLDERKTFEHYGYIKEGTWHLDFDDIRFLNHADIPNLSLAESGIIAARDIESGEELTQNYRDFEDEIRFQIAPQIPI